MTESDREMTTEDLERELERRKGKKKQSAWVAARARIIGWIVVLVGGGGGFVDSWLKDQRGEEIAIYQQAQLQAIWRKINENENRSRDNSRDLEWVKRLGAMDNMLVEVAPHPPPPLMRDPDAGEDSEPPDELFGDTDLEEGASSSTTSAPLPPAPRAKTYKPSATDLREAREQIQQLKF